VLEKSLREELVPTGNERETPHNNSSASLMHKEQISNRSRDKRFIRSHSYTLKNARSSEGSIGLGNTGPYRTNEEDDCAKNKDWSTTATVGVRWA